MAKSSNSETFRHRDGHVTGLAHYGNLNGTAVFYFHGLPSSRLEGAMLDEAAKQADAHLIALDRPGIGLSSPMPGRMLLDWPPLVLEIAGHLALEEFYVLGASAGGAYALACAQALPPHKLKAVGIIAGMSPVALGLKGMALSSKLAIYATKWVPSLGRVLYDWMVIPAAQNPDPAVFEKLVTDGLSQLSESDKRLLEDNQLKDVLVAAA